MPSGDPALLGLEGSTQVRRAQEGVRDSVRAAAAASRTSRPGWRRRAAGLTAATVVVAAAVAPVALPLLAGGAGSAVLAAGLAQIGAVGSGLLTDATLRVWNRYAARGRSSLGEEEFRGLLAEELAGGFTGDSSQASGLRSEVAGVLRVVDAVGVALTATVKESADDVRTGLVMGLQDLGARFAEFDGLTEDVHRRLSEMAPVLDEIAAVTRHSADMQQQILVELRMPLPGDRRPGRSTGAGHAGSAAGQDVDRDADEERAAALDAAGVAAGSVCPYPGLAAFQPASSSASSAGKS